MSQRDKIRMTDDEVKAFLAAPRVMNIATNSPSGHPHLVAMWYGFDDDGNIVFETYKKSQKILNLRRDEKMTALVEDGDNYMELKGVQIIGRGVIVEDPDYIHHVGRDVVRRYQPEFFQTDEQLDQLVTVMVAKRFAVRLEIDEIVSWDHAKLAG